MPAPVKAHELLDQLRQAQLLTTAEVDALRLDVAESASSADLSNLLVQRGRLTQFQADQVARGFASDLTLGKYQILESIGQGGMGGVFKAVDTRLRRIVALKMIRPELLQNDMYVKRFQREAEAAAQIMHQNVVVLYDIGEENGTYYYAMEYVEGIDLARMVQEQGLMPIQMACDYIRQAAAGLAAAHDRGLVHRDIKPANLLVTRPTGTGLRSGPVRLPARSGDTPAPGSAVRGMASVVKILDMGLVKDTEAPELSALTISGTVVGTPDFIAPEQAINASTVDHRADIYSLGCTFYYLLTGRPPYGEGSAAEKLQKHVNERESPRPVQETRRGLPPEVSLIISRMMAKRPDSRYQSAHDVVDDLTEVQRLFASGAAGRPTNAPEIDMRSPASSSAETLRPKVDDTPQPPTYAIGLDSVVLPARRSAVLPGHKGYVTALAFSPNGRLLASGGVDEVVRLWDLGPMLDQAGARPTELGVIRGQLSEVQVLAFDPTGTYLVTGSANTEKGPMWRWEWRESDPTKARTMVPSQPIQVDSLAFNRDGTRMAATVRDAVFIWGISRKGVVKEKILRGHNTAARAIAFHPDGTKLIIGGEDTTIRIIEFGWLRSTIKPPLTGHTDMITSLAYSPTGNLLVTSSKDSTVRVWDGAGADTTPRAVLTGHKLAVRLARFTPRGNQIVSVGDGGQVHLWDIATQAAVREWAIDKTVAHSVAMSPDGRYLAVGTADRGEGLVSLYDLELIMVEQLAPTAAGI